MAELAIFVGAGLLMTLLFLRAVAGQKVTLERRREIEARRAAEAAVEAAKAATEAAALLAASQAAPSPAPPSPIPAARPG